MQSGRRGHWEPLRIRLTAMLMAGRFAHDTTALPLDVTVLPQSPQTPTRHLSPAAQALPVTPDRTLKGRDWTLSHRPTEPRKHVYCSSGSYCCVGSAVVCAQLSAGSRKDTTATGRKPNLCSPQERAWLGEARVVCKAQARGSAPVQKAPPSPRPPAPVTTLGITCQSLQVCRVHVGPSPMGNASGHPLVPQHGGRMLRRAAWSQRQDTSTVNV